MMISNDMKYAGAHYTPETALKLCFFFRKTDKTADNLQIKTLKLLIKP